MPNIQTCPFIDKICRFAGPPPGGGRTRLPASWPWQVLSMNRPGLPVSQLPRLSRMSRKRQRPANLRNLRQRPDRARRAKGAESAARSEGTLSRLNRIATEHSVRRRTDEPRRPDDVYAPIAFL